MKEIKINQTYGDLTVEAIEIKTVTFSDKSEEINKIEGKLIGRLLSTPVSRNFTYFNGLLKMANHLKLEDYQLNHLKEIVIDKCENLLGIESAWKTLLSNDKVYTALCFIVGLLVVIAWLK